MSKEDRKLKVSVALSPSVLRVIDRLASSMGMSRSSFIEFSLTQTAQWWSKAGKQFGEGLTDLVSAVIEQRAKAGVDKGQEES